MFKFRRSSLCSNPEVVSNNSGSDDEQQSFAYGKDNLRNSISESRLASSCDSPDEKESLSDSSSETALYSAKTETSPDQFKTTVFMANTEVVFEKCRFNGSGESSTVAAAAMSDRKRKERHESSSQEQEKKVIRGNDDPDVTEVCKTENDRNEVMTTLSCDRNANDVAEIIPVLSNDSELLNLTLDSTPLLHTPPQLGYAIRTMPDFEPEIQRQWERTAAQWNARKMRRSHRSRHSGRNTKSFSEVDDDIMQNGNSQACQLEGLSISSAGNNVHMISQDKDEEVVSDVQNWGMQSDVEQDSSVDESEIPEAVNLAPLPTLDLSTLHQSVDSHEPISACRLPYSSDQAMLSPRNNSLINRIGLSAPTPPLHQSPVNPPVSRLIMEGNHDSKISALLKHIGNFKKQIRMLESEFEQMFGHKPSTTERQSNKDMRKILLLLARAKRELQILREDPGSQNIISTLNQGSTLNAKKTRFASAFISRSKSVSDESLKQLEILVGQIQTALEDNRKVYARPVDPLLMTQQELVSEKNSMQKQLLVLERRYGRPENKEEKELVKNLYYRYRLVKKLSFRFSAERENSFDLVPIMEHETLEFHDTARELGTESEYRIPEIKMDPPTSRSVQPDVSSSGEQIDLKNEDFNDMNLPQLESKHKLAADEKRRLRAVLRKFEIEFQNTNGRAPLKEDKYFSNELEQLYLKYKHFRANTKLLEVLIAKKKYPFSRIDIGKVED